jgi:hypothetical protein
MNNDIKDRIFISFCKRVLPVWGAISIIVVIVIFMLWNTLFDDLIWKGYYSWLIIIINLIIYSFSIPRFGCEVQQNTCLVYQNSVTGSLNPKWPGFNWVGLFEKPLKSDRFEINTQKHITTTEEGDWNTSDDTLVGRYKILWRVDTKNTTTRDQNIKSYVGVTDPNIVAALTLSADVGITVFCNSKTAENAKKDMESILSKDTFKDQVDAYGIEILETEMEDLDYSKEIQDARKSSTEMKAFRKAFLESVDELMYDPTKNPHGCKDPVEAQKIVKAKMLSGNYKQVDVSNTTGTPIVLNP